jgi:hypothetical protein
MNDEMNNSDEDNDLSEQIYEEEFDKNKIEMPK